MTAERFDLAVVGAGSAGLIAADFARTLGARVALCERERVGGDCTWWGCVPSKSLLKAASVAHVARTAGRFGIHTGPPVTEMAAVRSYVRDAIGRIAEPTSPEALRAKGIEVILGETSFVDARTLRAGGRTIRARRILVATGAVPEVPPIPGLDGVPYLTYREIFENDRLPEHLLVVGAGPIGVEVGQAYRRLGARVTIFGDPLLPRETPEAAAVVRDVLLREGLELVASRPSRVDGSAGAVTVHTGERSVAGDVLFVATGRRPRIDGLQLERAAVRVGDRGIEVDEYLRTSARRVYAAGDVLGGDQFSHLAGWQAFHAVRNALLPGRGRAVPRAVPRVTFCDPEVAHVGLTEAEARERHGRDVTAVTWPISRDDRAICDGARDGLITLVARKNGTLLGATIVAQRAGDAIAELALAVDRRCTLAEVAASIHAYPTYASAVQLLTTEMATRRALRGVTGRLIRLAVRSR